MTATRKLLLSLMLALAIAVSPSLVLTFLPGKALATEYDYDIKNLSGGYMELDGPELVDYAKFAYTGTAVDIQETVYGPEVELDGEWISPVLEYGVDYTLSFRSVEDESILSGAPIEVGEYCLVATGAGEYSGSTEAYFAIVDSYDLAECNYDVLPGWDVVMGVVPTVEVYLGEMKLIEGEDYRFEGFFDSDTNPIDDIASASPGNYMAKITGIDPYHGTVWLGISVYAPNNLDYATIWHDGEEVFFLEVDYTGKPLELDVVVKGGDGSVLQEGVDYVVSYYDADENLLDSAPVEVGHYQMMFEGIEAGSCNLGVSIVTPEGSADSDDPVPPKDEDAIVDPENPAKPETPAPPEDESESQGNELPKTGDTTLALVVASSLLLALSAAIAAFALRHKMI